MTTSDARDVSPSSGAREGLDLAGIVERASRVFPDWQVAVARIGQPEGVSDRDLEYIAGMDPATTLALVARVRELEAEVERLAHLLGSHVDGHRCLCEMTFPGSHISPPEWEQNPWCPTHPDVDYILDQHTAATRRAEAAEARLDAVRAYAQTLGWGVGAVILRMLDAHGSDATASEPTVERITDVNGDEMEHGADTDAKIAEAAERPSPSCYDDRCSGMPACLRCADTDAEAADQPQPTSEACVVCEYIERVARTAVEGSSLAQQVDDLRRDHRERGRFGGCSARQQGEDRTDTPGGQR